MGDLFQGKTAIITGGASGIGRALGEALGRRKCRVVLVDFDEPKLREAEGALRADGVAVRAACVDVRDRPALTEVVEATAREHGRLDYMFNNAGISVFGEARDFDWDAWASVIDTNLLGVVNGVFACYPIMVRQRSGHIVNTSSLAGLVPTPGAVSYTAAKCGVLGLSHALRAEAGPLGVRVSVVCPAAVWTSIIDSSRYVNLDKKSFIESVPGNRITAEACVRAILRGVERNRGTIAPSASKWIWRIHRYFPFLTNFLMRKFAAMVAANRARVVAAADHADAGLLSEGVGGSSNRSSSKGDSQCSMRTR